MYASSQASLQRSLAKHFQGLWTSPLNEPTENNGDSKANNNGPNNEVDIEGNTDDDESGDDEDVDVNEVDNDNE